MSRAGDFVMMGVIYLIAIVIHRISIALFAPGTGLHEIASTGTEVFNGAGLMDQWYVILAIWIPMIAMVGITAFVAMREYKRQTIGTTTGPVP